MRICRDTKSTKGCGKSKPDIEFKIIRINKNTGVAYRKRLCRDCENESYRVKRRYKPINEKELYIQFDRLARTEP